MRLPLLLCAVVVLFGIAGCKSKTAPVHYLDRVEISGATVQDNALLALKPEDVRALLEERLAPPSFVTLKPGQAPPEGAPVYRATLELAYTRETSRSDREGRWAEVGATLSLRRAYSEDRQRYDVSGLGEERVHGEDLEGRQLALRKALTSALDRVALHARLQLDALTKTDAVLVEELKSSEEAVQHYALQVLAARRHPAAGPLLIEQLRSEDLSEVRSAMGALVEMRELKAVPALIELTRGRDSGFERELLFAISGIGGDEARAYLFTVAQGHDDPGVRTAAEEALQELEARSKLKGPAPTEARRP